MLEGPGVLTCVGARVYAEYLFPCNEKDTVSVAGIRLIGISPNKILDKVIRSEHSFDLYAMPKGATIICYAQRRGDFYAMPKGTTIFTLCPKALRFIRYTQRNSGFFVVYF